jgi:hypothetical protein
MRGTKNTQNQALDQLENLKNSRNLCVSVRYCFSVYGLVY